MTYADGTVLLCGADVILDSNPPLCPGPRIIVTNYVAELDGAPVFLNSGRLRRDGRFQVADPDNLGRERDSEVEVGTVGDPNAVLALAGLPGDDFDTGDILDELQPALAPEVELWLGTQWSATVPAAALADSA